MEDLFVSDKARGQGVATKLIRAVADAAKQQHCERVYWYTQDHNEVARKLYDKLSKLSDFIQYRMPLS